MRTTLLSLTALICTTVAQAQTTIGDFDGGVAESGWGRFSGGVQPLDASVYPVTDLGDGGALETNLAGFSDSIAYSFTTAGTVADFFANDQLVFDVIYRGTATEAANGGFSQVFQVLFQSDFNGFALTSFQNTADGISLTQFGGGGTSAGWAPGDAGSVQTITEVTIDYSAFKETLPDGFNPSTLQFWMSTNDDNRVFKAIDNVRLTQAIPEPASAMLVALAVLGAGSTRRTQRD